MKGKNKNFDPYPEFLGSKSCVKCNRVMPSKDYLEIGFYVSGEKSGKLFMKYKCGECGTNGIITVGDEEYTLEKLCSLVISQSKFLKKSEKKLWSRKYEIDEENKNGNDQKNASKK